MLGQHLQGHVPVKLRVPSLPDFTHTAFADLGGDLVGTGRDAVLEGHLIDRYRSVELLDPVQDNRKLGGRLLIFLDHQEPSITRNIIVSP